MLVLIKIVATMMIVGLGTYLNEWLRDRWLNEWNHILVVVIIAVIAAVMIVLVDFVSESLGHTLLKPVVIVQTSKQGNEIGISIKIKGTADRISLNYPVLGVITNFHDLNSLTDARTVTSRVIGGMAQSDVQNNMQITITDIKKDAALQYKIFYKQPQEEVRVGGLDRYELVYVWEYSAEKIQNTEWRMVEDDSLTVKPAFQTVGMRVFNRALTPEDIKKLYEAGPPQWDI